MLAAPRPRLSSSRLLAVSLSIVAGGLLWGQQQPIEFPHDKHVAAGVDCIDCHSGADIRSAATIPSINKCMLCHERLANEGPGVKLLIEFWNRKREVPWQRVYRFERAANVKFRHAPHTRAKIECSACHGNVAAMTVAQKAVEHTMGTCVSCHRQTQASDDCAVCHF